MSALIVPTIRDPKEELWEKLGDIDDIEVFNNQVLVAVYIRPKTMQLGGKEFILTDNTTAEDRYQSKIGMILKMGPGAFQDAKGVWFAGSEFRQGDLVVYRSSDGLAMELVNPKSETLKDSKVLCRVLDDTAVRMRVNNVSRVW